MSWKEKAVALYKRFVAPAKFAAKLVLGALFPGGSAVVELVEQALDCVHETAKDNLEIDETRLPAATAADLKRVEEMLDVLGGDLAGLTAQVAALEGLPEAATKILYVALKTDDRCRAALHKLDALAQGFDALGKQNAELLRGQGVAAGLLQEMLPLMRRMAGVADFVDDLCAEGLTAAEFRAALADFCDGVRAMARGRVAEANARLEEVARARPTSVAAAVAVAAAQTAKQDYSGAEKTLVRATRLHPEEASLAALARRATQATHTTPTAQPSHQPARPQRQPGELYTNSLGMKFAWIPPGTFLMGSPINEVWRSDEWQHKVTLTKAFWMGVHPVTQAQWQAVMRASPSQFKSDYLPVEQISWDDAVAFCQTLGQKDGNTYRLPTEAEWEYACRAGTTTPFHFGPTISPDQANYNGRFTYGNGKKGVYRQKTTPVGTFPPNAWGLYDMHGNVLEWCQDWYEGSYKEFELTDPQGGNNGTARVLRGGSWGRNPRDCRAATRNWTVPGHRDDNGGCRVCLCLD